MVTKKYAGKKNTPGKKNTAEHKKEWVSAEKKIQPEKKNTADQQKEWVSGSISFPGKKNTRPLAELNTKLNQTTALLLFGWVFGVQLDSLEKKWLA